MWQPILVLPSPLLQIVRLLQWVFDPSAANVLHLVSWNVAGWAGKFGQSDFFDFVKKWDVLCFQEVWLSSPPQVDGFRAFLTPAVPGLGRGRLKGGLLSLVSTNLSIVVESLPAFDRYTLVVKLNLQPIPLILVNVYFPPLVGLTTLRQIWINFEKHLGEIQEAYPSAQVVILGDFNAKMGRNDLELFTKFGASPRLFLTLLHCANVFLTIVGVIVRAYFWPNAT